MSKWQWRPRGVWFDLAKTKEMMGQYAVAGKMGHTVREASGRLSDLQARLLRAKWAPPQRKRPMGRYLPVMTDSERGQLRTKLQELNLKWERESKLKQVTEEKDSKKEKESKDKKTIQTLDDVTMTDLKSQGQALDRIAEKMKEESQALNLSNVTQALGSALSLLPQAPTYISNVAQNLILQPKAEEQERKKKKKASDASGSGETEEPHWKRHVGTTQISKTTIDARTRFCVNGLRNVVYNDTRCLKKLEILCAHLHQYPFAKGVAVRERAIGELLNIRNKTGNDSVKILVREALDLCGHHDHLPNRGIRVLCLDGGGMRGIVALEVLGALERNTGKKIHELFDFICGVSTGAIIAAFLAFHRKSVSEVETTYANLGKRVFTQDLIKGATGWLMSHSYYDTPQYEKTLQSFVGEMKLNETLRSEGTPKAALISTLVSGHRIMPYVFRNYQYPYRSQSFYRGSAKYAIWEAVRASSAAPGYFDEFVLNDKIHHDGGIMTNNATILAVHEAQKLWPNDSLQCVVSLGMGRHERPITFDYERGNLDKPKALSLAQKFARVVDAATDTEIAHVTLHDLLPGHVYYRFNPFLSEYYPIDEVRKEKMNAMRDDTRMYMRRNHNRILQACDQLQLERRFYDKARDKLTDARHILNATGPYRWR